MDAGYRNLFGFWLGGIFAPSGAQAGYRSLSHIWMGGTSGRAQDTGEPVLQASPYWGPMETSPEQAGYRSIFGFYLGGLCGP